MTANHVLGVRAVLPDGEVVTLGGASVETVGPDLVGMYCGHEGLFGVALEITLRLVPRPESYRTLLAAYPSLEAAGDAVGAVVSSGLLPAALEIMDRLAIEAAEAAVAAGYPRDAAALLIVELDGEADAVEADFARLEPLIRRTGASSLRIAKGDAERAAIWKGRKSAFSAVGRLSPDFLVQDGVVPRARLGEALARIEQLAAAAELRVANVFHAGDGNLHPLILFDGRRAGELERAEALAGRILRLCIELGGSITGEHGVGLEKRAYLPEMFDRDSVAAMWRIRSSIDPALLSNPGKMFPGNMFRVDPSPISRSSADRAQAPAARGLHPLERDGVLSQL
jgi:glycolate oxidase